MSSLFAKLRSVFLVGYYLMCNVKWLKKMNPHNLFEPLFFFFFAHDLALYGEFISYDSGSLVSGVLFQQLQAAFRNKQTLMNPPDTHIHSPDTH